ncbi:hypothetical protein RQP46_007872 [Phenoliferia psychrophenolica]
MAFERVLTGDKLSSELDFFKKHSDALGSLKQVYSPSHVPPPAQRPKRATLANIPVCEPPTPSTSYLAPAASAPLSLTIKCAKPPLVFTLACPPTATIATLKALLCSLEPTAPPVEQQRWILKGKSMGDAKLVREFPVEDGSVINLMLNKAAPPPATVVPDLVLSSSDDPTRPALAISTDDISPPPPPPTGIPAVVGKPELWVETFEVLKRHFGEGRDAEAREVWESWLGAAQGWIQPGEKALIRERTGISAMGGL